ncbi:ABC transporter ATP-binding protein [Leadbettera azotonutricia]|uniref:Oligopeptide transport ATP-binding protein AppF n=1 Tax=Leadbettera azotonutricia (strain ATCC BAA-888 / DSM 13862 / ZAS-9) TaxID=545695 RepID=F5Y6Z8_LEAAZ|nr:oligopeptide/dipeptide ABC transporter ATP-binding protein [Leadbettera azotonutricia]AEF82281.1 oligopeptide transport ATP-binding protein AppF [Leadbettera azotonutricia ZAS-9]
MNDNHDTDLLRVENLRMHFPAGTKGFIKREKQFIYAVDGISFSIGKGETLGLVGESGCGKSTVVRALARLYTPTSGDVYLHGKNFSTMNKRELLEARRNMQIVFQNPYASLNPRMTTADIIAEPMRIYRRLGLLEMADGEIENRVEKLMDLVGLLKFYKNRYPHEFSGGQRQRIGIARSLALNPQLILADEPVSALDVSIQAQILNLFKDIQKEFGLSYLFIAHDLAVIEYISDRIAVMYLGKIVEMSGYQDLYKNPLHPYTQALLSSAPIPDPKIEAERKRIILTGDVPSPNVQRPGCYFYDRCPRRMDKCKQEQPVLKTVTEGHQVACFLQE